MKSDLSTSEGLTETSRRSEASQSTADHTTPASGGALLLVVLAGGAFLAPLNSTMIAVALPSLTGEFNVGVAGVTWLVTVYVLTLASLTPLAGRLGDLFGHRRLFLIGGTAMAGASIGAALAPTFAALVVFRGLQGVCVALLTTSAAAMIRLTFPAETRGRAFGWLAAILLFGAAIGPVLGGILVHEFGWSAIFWVNIPILAVVLPLALYLLPSTERDPQRKLDLPGAVLLTLTLILGVAALTSLRGPLWSTFVLAAATVLLAFVLVSWERRQSSPVLDPRLFRHPAYSGAFVSVLLSNLVMYTTIFAIPLFLAGLQDRGPAQIGWVLVVYSGLMSLCSPVGGYLSDRFGRAFPVFVGTLFMLAGAILLLQVDQATSILVLCAYLGVGAVGVGLQVGSQQTAALESAPAGMAGVAGGVWSTARYIGSITGAALLGVLFGGTLELDEFRGMLYIMIGAGLLLLPTAYLLRYSRQPYGLLAAEDHAKT